ncbi:response regulator [Alkalihalobacillus pseudalcaliphilus]|uniref:response regulator n=1 Tax=Alkalihalobacillus pseudalcaliphilus TaxID=79884 RepID=UPI00064DF0E8|nr:response regulator [Alkalihalobacillus pseudalcaliphilus]KMK78010.1 transcriptional regulator [Alkalihalobacillus pseudalcaliphilus]
MNVLVAEDDFRVAEIHRHYLQELPGIKYVERTANANETLLKLKDWPVDLLLLDVYLPDKLGTEMMEDFKKENPDLQIILITAATDMDIVKKAYLSGAVDYLVKPIALERLAEAVKKAEANLKILQSEGEATQKIVDDLFQAKRLKLEKVEDYPKGIDQLTLEKVKVVLEEQREGMAAEEVGQAIGVSRTTSRRYLEYLISVGEAKAELAYGIVGRPERKYVLQKKI